MPPEQIYSKFFIYVIIILSAVFHEYAHAWSAYQLGDTTAKDSGRLTLNPLKHLDPLGTVIIPLFLLYFYGMFIGWAKPVPYNPYNLKDQKYGDLKVGIAGPLANLFIAVTLGLVIRFFSIYLVINGLVNVLFIQFLGTIVYVNIFLALFNLIPIPPLDGSKVLMNLLPNQSRYLEQVGILGIFLALIISSYILSPIADFIFKIIVG